MRGQMGKGQMRRTTGKRRQKQEEEQASISGRIYVEKKQRQLEKCDE